jgi:phosphatidate cytidylyltransferase
MIRTRVLVGVLLALGAGGVLVGDTQLAQRGFAYFPFLFAFLMLAGVLGARELIRLFPPLFRPRGPLVVAGVLLLIAANWYPLIHLRHHAPPASDGAPVYYSTTPGSPWPALVAVFVAVMLAAFLVEMRRYKGESCAAVPRLGLTVLSLAYLGLLPCFFVQVRFLTPDAYVSAVMLALVVFVPKCNDVGAFFTGTFLGRNKMTPALSPKKTWEGFAGGMLTGGLIGVVGWWLAPSIFTHGVPEAFAFGLVAGLAGVLGDLAESLIKRDCATKDASQRIPGFGGVLDVVDSVLFAAPVAYLWFTWN